MPSVTVDTEPLLPDAGQKEHQQRRNRYLRIFFGLIIAITLLGLIVAYADSQGLLDEVDDDWLDTDEEPLGWAKIDNDAILCPKKTKKKKKKGFALNSIPFIPYENAGPDQRCADRKDLIELKETVKNADRCARQVRCDRRCSDTFVTSKNKGLFGKKLKCYCVPKKVSPMGHCEVGAHKGSNMYTLAKSRDKYPTCCLCEERTRSQNIEYMLVSLDGKCPCRGLRMARLPQDTQSDKCMLKDVGTFGNKQLKTLKDGTWQGGLVAEEACKKVCLDIVKKPIEAMRKMNACPADKELMKNGDTNSGFRHAYITWNLDKGYIENSHVESIMTDIISKSNLVKTDSGQEVEQGEKCKPHLVSFSLQEVQAMYRGLGYDGKAKKDKDYSLNLHMSKWGYLPVYPQDPKERTFETRCGKNCKDNWFGKTVDTKTCMATFRLKGFGLQDPFFKTEKDKRGFKMRFDGKSGMLVFQQGSLQLRAFHVCMVFRLPHLFKV